MAFFDKVYTVNWKKLAVWLTPIVLRRNPYRAFVDAAITPTSLLHGKFGEHKKYIAYWLGIDSQVWRMEKALNDRFDIAQRRIRIVDNVEHLPMPLYQPEENKPVKLYQPSEAMPMVLYTLAETAAFSFDFVIEIPLDVVFDMNELRAFVDSFKTPSKTYSVKTV